jgi:hypothetical protein
MLLELSVVEQRYQALLAVIRDGVPSSRWPTAPGGFAFGAIVT